MNDQSAPIRVCPRCSRPTHVVRENGFCNRCEAANRAQKRIEYDERIRDLVWKNRGVIDFTGFEDILADINKALGG